MYCGQAFEQTIDHGCTPTPKKNACHDLFATALATPPPPAKRGAIRASCRVKPHDSSVSCGNGGLRAYIERARTGHVRTTLRVRIGFDSPKVLWAEVSLKVSDRHSEIIETIKSAIDRGKVLTKEVVAAMRERLIFE